ncbi:MAG: Amuc_1098 family type IV pilus outer membrane protein [Akkermansiaceae bacterium]
MEKRFFLNNKHVAHTGIACAALMCSPLVLEVANAQESLIQREINRRINLSKQAQDLLISGDVAYKKKDYGKATQDYAEALQLTATDNTRSQLRSTVVERYSIAATENSKNLIEQGKYQEARELLNTVLTPKVNPNYQEAIRTLKHLDDPIRNNPALTEEHVEDVVKVKQLLVKGDGFYSLGQYDDAASTYHQVLNIDPFNKAARRSLEKINTTKSDYYRAARDHTRTALLTEIDKGWELRQNSGDITLPFLDPIESSNLPKLEDKLSGITIESVVLDDVSIEEALDFIRVQSRLGDAPNALGEQEGINVILNLDTSDDNTSETVRNSRINIRANNLPLSVVLDYITEQTRTQWKSDGVSINIYPIGSTDATLLTQSFRVPPNFLRGFSASQSSSEDDIFGSSNNDQEGKLAKKITAKEYFEQNGISFPEGTSAQYISASNVLIVTQTPQNIDLIERITSLASQEEPVQIITRTTIIRVTEEELKELGFDWLISLNNPLKLDTSSLFGGSVGVGEELDVTEALSGIEFAPITAGLRSGTSTTLTNAIDSVIAAENTGFASTQTRAPGILSVTGVYSGAQVQLIMRGLDQSKSADIMVQPSIISRSGERSEIKSVREIIYATEYEPPELTENSNTGTNNNGITFIDLTTGETASASPATGATPSHPTAFETRAVGVTVGVEATVSADKKFVDLSLAPELVEFEGFVNYGSVINGKAATAVALNTSGTSTFTLIGGEFFEVTPNEILMPVFKTITTEETSLTIQDGATIVIGGLVSSKRKITEDKVPFLGDLPIAGRLFRTDASHLINEAIIIMVNVELIDPTGTPWKQR